MAHTCIHACMQVDEHSRSVSVPNIWAIGDVSNRVPLTPAARMEGTALANALFGCGARSALHADGHTACSQAQCLLHHC